MMLWAKHTHNTGKYYINQAIWNRVIPTLEVYVCDKTTHSLQIVYRFFTVSLVLIIVVQMYHTLIIYSHSLLLGVGGGGVRGREIV